MKNKYIGCVVGDIIGTTLYYIEADNELNAYKKLLTNEAVFLTWQDMISSMHSNDVLCEFNNDYINNILACNDVDSIFKNIKKISNLIALNIFIDICELSNLIKKSLTEKSSFKEQNDILRTNYSHILL
jgi:hypothetical protein